MKRVLERMIIMIIVLSLSGCTSGRDSFSDTANTGVASEETTLSENAVISGTETGKSGEKTEIPAAETKETEENTETLAAETEETEESRETSVEETSETESAETMPQVIFEETDDYIYSMVPVHVRTGPGKSYSSAGCLEKGERVHRIGIGNNGWDQIIYGTGIGYVSGNFMTTRYSDIEAEDDGTSGDKDFYTVVDETVYSAIILNVRTGPGTGYKKVGGFEKGEAVHRVAVGNNGWSKVEFRGGVYYACSEYLSAVKPGAGQTVSSLESKKEESKPLDDSKNLSEKKIRVTVRWSGSNIRLDWTACDDVSQYIIYRKANWQKYELDRLASGPGQAFTDTTAVSDAEYFSDKGVLGLKTEYYDYYICAEYNGSIVELGNCRISMDR